MRGERERERERRERERRESERREKREIDRERDQARGKDSTQPSAVVVREGRSSDIHGLGLIKREREKNKGTKERQQSW